jgi:hypothetical protein
MSQKIGALSIAALLLSLNACSGNQGTGQAPLPNGIQNASNPVVNRPAFARTRPNVSPYTYVESKPGITAEATCPTGDVVLGGGFDNVSQTKSTTESHYDDNHTAWVSSNPYSVYSYAICADKDAVQTQYLSASWTTGEVGTVQCNGSSYGFSGGGFKFTAGKVAMSFPDAYWLWAVESDADFNSAGTVYGICTQGGHTAYTYVSSSPSADAVANCPSGDVVVGGGFVESNPIDQSAVIYRSHYYNSQQSWRASISSNTVTAYAVCASGS